VIDWHTFLFMLFALVAVVFAGGVVFSNNIVRMAFYLTLSLGATSGLFFLAGAEFVGAMQLLIYVGGTLVLLIFGVMLTARDAFISMKTRPADWVLGVLVGGSLLVLLLFAAFTVDDWRPPENWAEQRAKLPASATQDTTRIGLALVGPRIDKQDKENESRADGLSGYFLPFEIVSVHLLVVLIGAGYLARTKRRRAGAAMSAEAARAAIPAKRRAIIPDIALTLLLAGDVVGVGGSIYCLAQLNELSIKIGEFDKGDFLRAAPDWFLPVVITLLAVRALCLLALLFWQKWGFGAMVLISVALPIVMLMAYRNVENVNFSTIGMSIGAGMLVGNVIVVALVAALLARVGRPTMWSQLE
jgi:NADH-quinone oxidoreductase subunit J